MKDKPYSFSQSNKLGKTGEQIIYNYLFSLPDVIDIIDVSDDYEYQEKDIDLLVEFKNKPGKYKPIEIKTDSYNSGNIFYETKSCVELGTLGCMEKTKARLLLYYFINTKELYQIVMNPYRKWFEENRDKFSKKSVVNYTHGYDEIYHTIGYTIPKKFLEKNFNDYKKIII